MKLLKDVIAVKKKLAIQSSLITLPETVDRNQITGVQAEVKHIGVAFRHKGLVNIGDTVVVPNHLGNRHIINGEELHFYDGEDILAIISGKF